VVTVTAAGDPTTATGTDTRTGGTGADGATPPGESGTQEADGEPPGATTGAGTGAGASASASAVTRAPTRLSRRLSLLAAVTVTVLAGTASLPALALGLTGAVTLWGATLNGRQGLVDLGGVVLLATTVLAGTAAAVPVTLVCTVGSVVAWDVATNAVELG